MIKVQNGGRYKLLTPRKDLKLLDGILPLNRQLVCGLQFKLVHVRSQEVCLVMCVDYEDDSKNGVKSNAEIYVIHFGFELLPSRDALGFKMVYPLI